MALTQKRLADPQAVITTASSTTKPTLDTDYVYSVPAGTTTIVKQIMLANVSSETIRVTLWLKPSAVAYASMGNAQIIYHDYAVEPNATSLLNLSLVMTASDRIYARTATSSTVNITISGLEEA